MKYLYEKISYPILKDDNQAQKVTFIQFYFQNLDRIIVGCNRSNKLTRFQFCNEHRTYTHALHRSIYFPLHYLYACWKIRLWVRTSGRHQNFRAEVSRASVYHLVCARKIRLFIGVESSCRIFLAAKGYVPKHMYVPTYRRNF